MSIEIDSRVGNERKQFATQIPPEFCQMIIDSGFHGDETPDFYEGLLAGYAVSLSILNQMTVEYAKVVIGSFIAHIAKFTIESGISTS